MKQKMKQREIKFRAWDKIDEKMLYPKNTQLVYHGESSDTGWTALQYGRYSETKNHIILLQFAGLHDKNGKEIYEGDIVKIKFGIPPKDRKKGNWTFDTEIKVVEWDKYLHGFISLIPPKEDIEVIGNIFESPELLNPTNQCVRSHKAKKQK